MWPLVRITYLPLTIEACGMVLVRVNPDASVWVNPAATPEAWATMAANATWGPMTLALQRLSEREPMTPPHRQDLT